jgi:hypothetical protein
MFEEKHDNGLLEKQNKKHKTVTVNTSNVHLEKKTLENGNKVKTHGHMAKSRKKHKLEEAPVITRKIFHKYPFYIIN